MKKLTFTGVVAAAVLLMAGCSDDCGNGRESAAENVRLTVTLPAQPGSRAFADGLSATELDYAVYDAAGNFIISDKASFDEGSLSTTVTFRLANGKNYQIAFFAHNGKGSYSFDGASKTVTVNYDAMTEYNTVDHDAFYKLHETGLVAGALDQSVTLKRPVAQINWGTADMGMYEKAYGDDATALTTKILVKDVYKTFDLLTGKPTGATADVTFPAMARPQGEDFPVEPATYAYLSMNYVLVPADGTLVQATLTPNNGTADMPEVIVPNVPLQANYRTNIFGQLLTSRTDITVTKDKTFTLPDNEVDLNE